MRCCKDPSSWTTTPDDSKCTFEVADRTGSCSLIVWDGCITEEIYQQIHPGSVIYIEWYKVKSTYVSPYAEPSKTWPGFFKLPLELHLQRNFRQFNHGLKVVTDATDLVKLQQHLPERSCTFTSFDQLQNHVFDEEQDELNLVNVIGVVIGISRYYRRKGEGIFGRGMVTFRWLELWEPDSKTCIAVKIHLNSQLTVHCSLRVGDILACTWMRVCRSAPFYSRERGIYLCCTWFTEIFRFTDNVTCTSMDAPLDVRNVAMKMTNVNRASQELPSWVGGAYPFESMFLENASLFEQDSGHEDLALNIPMLFTNMELKETVNISYQCRIVHVEYCTILNVINIREHRLNMVVENRTLYKMDAWDIVKKAVSVYGIQEPSSYTLPIKSTKDNTLQLHHLLEFPVTKLVRDQTSFTISDVELMCSNSFYRIHLLADDGKSALCCLLLPGMFCAETTTFYQLLTSTYEPLRAPMASPIKRSSDSKYSSTLCQKSGLEGVGSHWRAVLQVNRVIPEQHEILFCYME